MGKATGFLDYAQQGNPAKEPLTRMRTYNEFHTPLPETERRQQAARCMDCGVPFCQSCTMLGGMASGCPLGNLCPEWNDLLYKGLWDEAADRLLMTSPFPEFTARVCPALCEKACTNGLHGQPVTVKENELSIIEHAFSSGHMQPCPPRERSGKHVAVVGSGPAGLACAQRLNRFGHEVTVYERHDRAGGLLMYGIPNMKLEKHIIDRRIDLMKAEGIRFRLNCDIGVDMPAQELLDTYDAVVLACGASNPRNITAQGRETQGIYFAVDFLRKTTQSLLRSHLSDDEYISAKYKNVVVIGGGDTGNDCVGTCIRHGCKSVVQLEMMPKPPEARLSSNPWPEWPRVLKTDYGQEEAIAVFGQDPRSYQTTVKRFISENGQLSAVETVKLSFANGKPEPIPGSEEILPCELVLIAAGFLGAQEYVTTAFDVALTPRTCVQTAPGAYQTSREGVFTAGDMHRGQSLVVWALREGRDCAEAVNRFLQK